MWELQRFWDVQTAENKTETCLTMTWKNLDGKKTPVSAWLVRLRAEGGMMSYRSWMLKVENLSRKK